MIKLTDIICYLVFKKIRDKRRKFRKNCYIMILFCCKINVINFFKKVNVNFFCF